MIDNKTRTRAGSPPGGRAGMAALEGPPCRRVPLDPAVRIALQVVQRVEVVWAWPPALRTRLVWLVELLRTSERAERWVRGSLRAIERPEVPELAVWLAAGLIAMAAKMTATSKWRIQRDYRRDRGIALEGIRGRADRRSAQTCAIPPPSDAPREQKSTLWRQRPSTGPAFSALRSLTNR